jgi:hypothetical protein
MDSWLQGPAYSTYDFESADAAAALRGTVKSSITSPKPHMYARFTR